MHTSGGISDSPATRVRSSDNERKRTAHDEESASVAEVVPDRSEQLASHLQHSAAAMFLYATFNDLLPDFDVASFRRYRDQIIADSGHPTDPIEVMLIEQLALAHLNIGRLYYKAASAGAIECASAYLAAVARLMGELRRTSLALPAYREAARRLGRRAEDGSIGPGENDHDNEQGAERREEVLSDQAELRAGGGREARERAARGAG